MASIKFRCADAVDKASLYELIDKLLRALRMNGQICGREFPIAITRDGAMAMVIMLAEDSLHESQRNSYVRQDIEQFREIEVNGPHFVLIGADMSDEVCKCLAQGSTILYTHYVTLDSPLRRLLQFNPAVPHSAHLLSPVNHNLTFGFVAAETKLVDY